MANKQLILEIKALTQDATRRIGDLENKIDRTRKSNDRMRVSTEGMERSLGQLRNKILLVSFAFGGMTATIGKAVKEATKVQTLTRSFVNLGGQVGITESSLQKLRDATNGTVTDTELLIQANNALLLGIVQNEDQLAAMFDAAQRLAQAVGQDAVFGIESLTTGIGRQSRLMLDNLGIIVDTKKAYEDYAKANDLTVKSLTDFQRKQAFISATMDSVNEKLERAGEEVIDFNQEMARLPVAFTNLQVAIGTHLAPAFASFSTRIADSITQFATFIATLSDTQIENIKEVAQNIGILTAAFAAYTTVVNILNGTLILFAARFAAIVAAIEAVSIVRRNIEIFTAAILEMRLALAELTADLRKGTSDVIAKLGLDGVQIGMSTQEMDKLRERIESLRDIGAEDVEFGVIYDLLFGELNPEDLDAQTEKYAKFIENLITKSQASANVELEKNKLIENQITLFSRSAKELGKSVKSNEDIGEKIKNIIANLILEIAQLRIKQRIEEKITKEKEKQAKISAATGLGFGSAILSFVGGFFQTGGSYTNRFATGGSFDVNRRTVLPTNPPALVGDNASGMERVDITPLPAAPSSNGRNITINISAPLVDETVVDTIIPAIRKAEKLGL
jgi:hypothetical protein